MPWLDWLRSWNLARRERSLRRAFLTRDPGETLPRLLEFLRAQGRPFPMEETDLRQRLLDQKSWDGGGDDLGRLLHDVEAYLLADPGRPAWDDWSAWLRMAQRSERAPLARLVEFDGPDGSGLPMDDRAFRLLLFETPKWSLPEDHRDYVLLSIERYLCSHPTEASPAGWKAWLRMVRAENWHPDVLNPVLCRALREAAAAGKLAEVAPEDHSHLLEGFRQAYGELLDSLDPQAGEEVLPLLLEYGSLAQSLPAEEGSIARLRRWMEGVRTRPRALASLSDEEALAAPLRGIGSPHGVAVTLYHEPGAGWPVRIVYGGTTGDPVLNSKIVSCLFAAALVCEGEPTLVTSEGGVLSMSPEPGPSARGEGRSLLAATIGPAGPMEPRADIPSLGMEAADAMRLSQDLLDKLEEWTGLVQVTRWRAGDGDDLETRIGEALATPDGQAPALTSGPDPEAPPGVLQATPMLYRDAAGMVAPVSIPVPYRVLGAERVHQLLTGTRRGYMQALLEAGRWREAFARRLHQEHTALAEQWRTSSPEEKARLIAAQPTFTITQWYDHELGIMRPLEQPYELAHADYEDNARPKLAENALVAAEAFGRLCDRLTELNQEGGRADVLAFKLLVDSMLRQAPIGVEDASTRRAYETWAGTAFAPVWKAVESWAEAHGAPISTLAADNVIFNATLDPDAAGGVVRLEPWVLADLHDFVVHVDRECAVAEVLPGGRTPRLADAVAPSAAEGITDAASLHRAFSDWLEAAAHPHADSIREGDGVDEGLVTDPQVGAMIQLRRAQRLMDRGRTQEALALLEGVRKADLAPVYLWGALYQEVASRRSASPNWEAALERLLERERSMSGSDGASAPDEREEAPGSPAISDDEIDIPAFLRTLVVPIPDALAQDLAWADAWFSLSPEVQRWWGQLKARSPELVEGLLQPDANLRDLLVASLGWSPEQWERYHAATAGLTALELLGLAQGLADAASELPLLGTTTTAAQKAVRQVVDRMGGMLEDPSCAEQLRKLADRL